MLLSCELTPQHVKLGLEKVDVKQVVEEGGACQQEKGVSMGGGSARSPAAEESFLSLNPELCSSGRTGCRAQGAAPCLVSDQAVQAALDRASTAVWHTRRRALLGARMPRRWMERA